MLYMYVSIEIYLSELDFLGFKQTLRASNM